jgi:acyl-CoA synthetase (AMP-forming)/AMP-acid ligase II
MVAILMGNKPEWIIADLAICWLGGIMVAVNTWVTRRELGYVLAHSDANTLIASDRFLKNDYFAMLGELEPLAQSMPRLKRIIHVGARCYRDSIPFDDVFARGCSVPDTEIDHAVRAIDPQDVAYLLYTSGSTSTPKGVQLQHYALIENMWHIGERMHVTEHDRLWLAVSLFWGLGCEYHSIISRAVSCLPNKTDEARTAIYERARTALQETLRNYDPPLSKTEIANAQTALDTAIGAVEVNFLVAAMRPQRRGGSLSSELGSLPSKLKLHLKGKGVRPLDKGQV